MEEPDSDGVDPPMFKRKARRHDSATEGSAATDSDMEVPPSKKHKGAKKINTEQEVTEKPVKKKKETIREAIAAVQQGQPVLHTVADGRQASGMREVVGKEKAPVVVTEVKKLAKDVSKRFGDGPQWNRCGEGNSYEGRKEDEHQHED
jgi:hypothetical protein